VHAGAGPDLDIYTTADNDKNADIRATIRAVTDINVEDMGTMKLGILSERDIDGQIAAGYGLNGGKLLGNVVAEGCINEIQVYGNVGRPGVDSVIYAGEVVGKLFVGNAGLIPQETNEIHPASTYTDTFGDLYSDVFMGGVYTNDLVDT